MRFIATTCLVLFSYAAQAGILEIPLRVPFAPISEALTAQLAASAATPNIIYQEGPCSYLHYDQPRLEARDGHLHFIGPGAAALGTELFGACQSITDWRGTMEFTLAPQLDSAGHLRLRIVDSKLSDARGKTAASLAFIWDLNKRFLYPRLEQFSYDIGASRDALLAVVHDAAPAYQVAALEQVVKHLRILTPRVEARDIVIPIALDIPDAWLKAPLPAAAETAPLTAAELEALEKTLQPFDAFLVYSIKAMGQDITDAALRERLFGLLLESRYRLVALLSGEDSGGPDPLRMLFIDTWDDLRAILDDAQQAGLLDASLLRYAAFINAGDALLALGRAAPGLGMHISVDGLRRLARSLTPNVSDDPLIYDENVDPQLRQMFDFEEPPNTAPPQSPAPATEPDHSWLDIFINTAHAAPVPPLDRWVPGRSELDAYRVRLAALLQQTADDELAHAGLDAKHEQIYRNLVPTTALIESCWRQYVRNKGGVSYLRSSAGSVGIMQINQHVWRGFYNLERLRWDTAYNARAGAQILMRYMKSHAIRYAARSGDLDHIPRATYAVYNAGPRAVGRFNSPRVAKRARYVDNRLWTIYQGIAAGGQVNLNECRIMMASKSTQPQF